MWRGGESSSYDSLLERAEGDRAAVTGGVTT